jgi:hypothetical protein
VQHTVLYHRKPSVYDTIHEVKYVHVCIILHTISTSYVGISIVRQIDIRHLQACSAWSLRSNHLPLLLSCVIRSAQWSGPTAPRPISFHFSLRKGLLVAEVTSRNFSHGRGGVR